VPVQFLVIEDMPDGNSVDDEDALANFIADLKAWGQRGWDTVRDIGEWSKDDDQQLVP
jgi:hypothetical protein